MPEKLVALKRPPAHGSQEAIEMLEKVLVEAKEGRVAAIAIAYVTPSNNASTGISRSNKAWSLIGAVQYLQHRLCTMVDNSPDRDTKFD